MSNDLINRKNAIESIWSIFNNKYNDASRFEAGETELARKVLVDAQRTIEEQPTAYDVDKVVEYLEKESQNIEIIYPTDQGYDYEDAIGIDIDKAKQIVKSGGIE